MNEIGITRSTYTRLYSLAHLRRGGKILVGVPDLFQPFDPASNLPCYQKYETLSDLIEHEIENIITHEVIHHVLKRFRACLAFDNIDMNNEISGVRG